MKETTGADFKSATDSENKKLFIETYGCQMNVADSEVIASIMQMAGYHVCETLDEADAVFMNTCSIRDNAEQKILNRLEFFHSMKKNKRRNLIVGVLGCMAERVKDDLIENHHVDLVVGPDAYLTLPDLVASVEAAARISKEGKKSSEFMQKTNRLEKMWILHRSRRQLPVLQGQILKTF